MFSLVNDFCRDADLPSSQQMAMVRIHPFTLQFDDADMEKELRSGTLEASRSVLILFGILDILCRAVFPLSNVMFDPASETSTAVAYTCIALTYATVLVALRYAHILPRHDAATFTDRVWMISWVTNVAVWWAMVHCGLARRLTPAEGQGAAVCCAMWAFVMVLQHTLHIGYKSRMIVMAMAVSIALTSLAWQKELLAALVFGEAVGFSMEHMVRSSYLPRAKDLEVLRVAKERSDYDFQLLAHSRTRGRSNCSKSNSVRSKSSSAASSRSNADSWLSSSHGELARYAMEHMPPSPTHRLWAPSQGASFAMEPTAGPSARPSLAEDMMRREASLHLDDFSARMRLPLPPGPAPFAPIAVASPLPSEANSG